MGMDIAVFRFCFIASEEIRLPPYKGSAFRGGFGAVFKRTVCMNPEKDCKSCLLKFRCYYSYIFETPNDTSAAFVKTTHFPHPYVLEPPLDNGGGYTQGERFTANLVLVGRAIPLLPYFVFVMEKLAENGIGKGKGRFSLEKVESLSHPSETSGKVIFEQRGRHIDEDIKVVEFPSFGDEPRSAAINSLTLEFLTPTRITSKNRLTPPERFDFLTLMKNLLRRIHLLGFHCDSGFEIDHRPLLSQAEEVETHTNGLRWHDWERYSARQDARMKLGGFKGKISFRGPIAPFMPFIKLGEYVHVGKDTSFGLGKYKITDNKGEKR